MGAGMTFGYIAALTAAGKPGLMKPGAASQQQGWQRNQIKLQRPGPSLHN